METLAQLLRRPRCRRTGDDRDVDDAPALVGEKHHDEQDTARRGRDHEEICRHYLSEVIRQRRTPGLRRWSALGTHVLCDGGLTDVDAELEQFTMDPRRAPERVRVRHRTNQRSNLKRDTRSTRAVTALPRPEQPKAPAVPGDDCLGFDDDERPLPSTPHTREARSRAVLRVSRGRSGRDRVST